MDDKTLVETRRALNQGKYNEAYLAMACEAIDELVDKREKLSRIEAEVANYADQFSPYSASTAMRQIQSIIKGE